MDMQWTLLVHVEGTYYMPAIQTKKQRIIDLGVEFHGLFLHFSTFFGAAG